MFTLIEEVNRCFCLQRLFKKHDLMARLVWKHTFWLNLGYFDFDSNFKYKADKFPILESIHI